MARDCASQRDGVPMSQMSIAIRTAVRRRIRRRGVGRYRKAKPSTRAAASNAAAQLRIGHGATKLACPADGYLTATDLGHNTEVCHGLDRADANREGYVLF